MLSKSECRSYLNDVKQYLNLTTFCNELGIARPHLTMFLKDYHYDHYLNVEKANLLVESIKSKILKSSLRVLRNVYTHESVALLLDIYATIISIDMSKYQIEYY